MAVAHEDAFRETLHRLPDRELIAGQGFVHAVLNDYAENGACDGWAIDEFADLHDWIRSEMALRFALERLGA
ncbi:MAG: hypothetical protein IJZ85_03000 [Lachnospiraceae bacterium]|nr:hypothetical protein [Lachnospiraceae bacterium]